jgi:CBS domain-containing protein
MPQVRDRMVESVVTIESGTSVVDAAKRMIREEKGPLPIVEGDRPAAMVTDRDIVAQVVAEGRDPSSTTVDDIASHELVTIGPDQDTNEARESFWVSIAGLWTLILSLLDPNNRNIRHHSLLI